MNKKTVTSSRLSQTSGISSVVHRAVQQELKMYIEPKVTRVSFGAQVSASGTIFSLTQNLVQGDGPLDNYTGQTIKPISVRLRVSVSSDQSFNQCRFTLFRWLDASAPAPNGVYDSTGGGWAPHSNILWVNRKKIIVLKDRFFHLLATSGTSAYGVNSFDISLNLENNYGLMTLPTGTSGATPQMNGLYLAMITDDLVPSQPAFVVRTELIYSDA